RQGDLYGDFLVARYRTDGTLDPTFGGGDGFTAIDFDARHDVARSVRLVGDEIIVGGYSAAQITPGTTTSNPRESGLDFEVARLNSDGSPDTAFDGDGHRLIDFGAADAAANDMAVLPTGQVYLVGTSAAAPYALAALKSDGSLDPAFDGDGLLLTQFDRDIRVATSVEAD